MLKQYRLELFNFSALVSGVGPPLSSRLIFTHSYTKMIDKLIQHLLEEIAMDGDVGEWEED